MDDAEDTSAQNLEGAGTGAGGRPIDIPNLEAIPGATTWLFWGTLLVVFDISVTSNGFRFDILNDTLGFVLLVTGLTFIRGVAGGRPEYAGIPFATMVTAVSIVFSLADFYAGSMPPAAQWIILLWSIVQIIATYRFLGAMAALLRDAGATERGDAWDQNRVMYVWCIIAPQLVATASGIAVLAGVRVDVPAALGFVYVVVVLGLGIIWLVTFLVLLHRTKGALRSELALPMNSSPRPSAT